MSTIIISIFEMRKLRAQLMRGGADIWTHVVWSQCLNSESLCHIVFKIGKGQITKDPHCQTKDIGLHRPDSNIYKL